SDGAIGHTQRARVGDGAAVAVAGRVVGEGTVGYTQRAVVEDAAALAVARVAAGQRQAADRGGHAGRDLEDPRQLIRVDGQQGGPRTVDGDVAVEHGQSAGQVDRARHVALDRVLAS